MQSKTILSGNRAVHEIRIEAHGKGGELGMRNIKILVSMIQDLREKRTPQEVHDQYLQITGYCACCVNSGFIDEKGADELMSLAAFLAGKEQARAEAERKKGGKL